MQRSCECVSVGEAPGWGRGSSAHEQEEGGCLPHGRDAVCSLSQQSSSGSSSQPSPISREHSRGTSSAWGELVAQEVLAGPGTSLLASPLLWAAAAAATKAKLQGRHHRAPLSRAHTSAESWREPEEPVVPDLLPRPGCPWHLLPSASATRAGDSLGGQQPVATLSRGGLFPTSQHRDGGKHCRKKDF